MTIRLFVLCLQVFVLLLNSEKAFGSGLRIAYHVICDGDNLINLSYNLMDSETEIYSNSIEMEGHEDESNDDREARLLKGICANGDFKEQMTEYPLMPTLQHGYVMIGLGESRQSSEPYGMANPMIRKADYDGKLRSNRMKKLRSTRMKKMRSVRMKKLRATRMKKSFPYLYSPKF